MDNQFPFKFLKLQNAEAPVDVTGLLVKETADNKEKNAPSTANDFEELKNLNQEIHHLLKEQIEEQKYQTYFAENISLASFNGQNLVFNATTSFIKKIVESNYSLQLAKAIRLVLGKDYNFEVKILSEEPRQENLENKNSYTIKKGHSVRETSFSINDLIPTKNDLMDKFQAKVIEELESDTKWKKIDKDKVFENFVVGSSNNLAFASCEAVAENPGTNYKSLYLHSASGLGKTHLLHAIANRVREKRPNWNICFITCNDFVDDFVKHVQNRKFQEFQTRYTQDIDILIIDDIHELKNKTETQNAFFNIFNELHNRNKQLIFTSDKPPKEITGIEERVKTRLGWGLIVDIQQPDLETRIAIIKRKAIEKDIYLPDDVVNLIASAIKSNVRELEASLIRLGLYSSVCKVDIDLEIAKEQLKIDDRLDAQSITFDSIIKCVSNYYKLPIADIRSKIRTKDLAHARHVGMYLTHKILKATLVEIGDYYGKRDHTSVMHAVSKIEQLIKLDQKLAQAVLEIENSL